MRADHEGLHKIIPGQRNLSIPRDDPFHREGPDITMPGEGRLSHRRTFFGESLVDGALNLSLQPSGQRNVVGVDSDLVVCKLALYEKDAVQGQPESKRTLQWLERVVSGPPSCSLRRIYEFSPVRRTSLGSTGLTIVVASSLLECVS